MQKRRDIQLAILAATILAAGLVGTTAQLVILAVAVPATFLSTGLSSTLLIVWIPSWRLLAEVLFIAARSTHISLEIVVLHFVVCHLS